MEPPDFTNDLRRVRGLLWQWGWLVLVATLVSGGLAYFLSIRARPIYQASTTILINQVPLARFADYNSVLTSERLAQTYAQLLTTRSIIEEVYRHLDLEGELDMLANGLQAQLIKDTQLIEISLDDTDPKRAASFLNALVDVFIERNQAMQAERFSASKENLSRQLEDINARIRQVSEELQAQDSGDLAERARLETTLAQYRQVYSSLLSTFEQARLAEAQSTSDIIQVEPATIPQRPIRPRPWINAALGSLIGAVLGVGIAFVKDSLDARIDGVDDVQRQLGLPVLGLIARKRDHTKLRTITQPFSPEAEVYRLLRTYLHIASADKPLRMILVTSPSPSDGKSTVAANLGVALAQGGAKVALLDADLSCPKIHEVLEMPNQYGVSNLLIHPTLHIGNVLQETKIPNLFAVTAGDMLSIPPALLCTAHLVEILEQVGKKVDVLVIDSPPVMRASDTIFLATCVDGILLVVNPRYTNLPVTKQAIERLDRARANILGVILNEVDFRNPHYSEYRGYPHYGGARRGNSSRKPGKSPS